VGSGVYDLSKTYNDTGSPDITQPSTSPDGGEAGYNKLKDKVPNLPSWSDLGSGIKLPNVPKPPSGTLDAQGYNDALDAWTYDEYMKQYYALMDKAADQADPIERERLKYSPGGFEGEQKTYEVDGKLAEPPGLTDAISVINDALAKALGALSAAWERYQKSLQPPVGGGQMKGGQGGLPLGSTTQRQGGAYNPQNPFGTGTLADSSFKKNKKQKGMKESKLSFELIQQFREGLNPDRPKKLKEQTTFAQMQQRIRDAKEKRREQQKKSEKLYIDTKKKGVKFYDKKGSGRLKDGKKVYD